MRFLLLFFAIPIIEIACLIKVGQSLGILAALVLLILSTIVGIQLLRIQGFFTFLKIQQRMQAGDVPTEDVLGSVLLALAGILFIIPGFVSSAVGFIFLLAPVRRALAKAWIKRSQSYPQGPVIIDAEYYRNPSAGRIINVQYDEQDDQ